MNEIFESDPKYSKHLGNIKGIMIRDIDNIFHEEQKFAGWLWWLVYNVIWENLSVIVGNEADF